MEKYNFKDIDTGKKYLIKAQHPDIAISKLNLKAKKKVNYTFLGFKK